jgi:hypothetical protein
MVDRLVSSAGNRDSKQNEHGMWIEADTETAVGRIHSSPVSKS